MSSSFVKSALYLPFAFVYPSGLTDKAFANRINDTYNLLGGLRTLGYSPISINFGERTLNGSTVCNSYTADYRLEYETSIKIFNLVVTKKDCPHPDPLSEQREAEYFDTITKVTKYIPINESYMMLSNASNQQSINLIFRK
ncbi:META domain-containing protein [Anabaena lutea]|uniref:META domain-containing protein n=1 Tax=Anabaena lutea FACHB-196 TaxID=2692881 RepID=A0ABR8FI65_9NOST|nr:META domain-containing protein [Anabaena lutea]MBD2569851.1 META domain-containing protein [Anabaena lutea FACHB-196]